MIKQDFEQRKFQFSKEEILASFNNSMFCLKEEFHKTGRFDDANTKLDEISKLLLMKYFDFKDSKNRLNLSNLERKAKQKFGNNKMIVRALQDEFLELAQKNEFINNDGTSIFGSNPHLNIQHADNRFAVKVLNIVNDIHVGHVNRNSVDLDLINETFGHFVRDNFRNHKEDAQYLTPAEVIEAMTELAFADIENDDKAMRHLRSMKKESFLVCDPTCGVGSFLVSAAQKVSRILNPSGGQISSQLEDMCSFVGQDKVDRMVRMSKMNYLFYNLNANCVKQGNSIIGDSYIDRFIGRVDLIITNPPFGAEFKAEDLLKYKEKYDILPKIIEKLGLKSLSSEIIMFDRCLKLLKPGGRLLIVIPDSVVSADGVYKTYREYLGKSCLLKAVIDLPSVTFAQAGTRTKCSVVYVQKPYDQNEWSQNGIFMAAPKDIGFEVKERLGTPVKFYKGKNDLSVVIDKYKQNEMSNNPLILSASPSVVIYPFDKIINGKWNANFYGSQRINAIKKIGTIDTKKIDIENLSDVAEFCAKGRAKKYVDDKTKCISVLHIREDCTIKIEEVISYKPTSPGNVVQPGEIIFSKINPRIPRVAVVPDLQYNLVCSSEFAILKAKEDKYVYLLKTMLLTDLVQAQINSLTSGTSSSHNRIKDGELQRIKIPWPKKGSALEKKILDYCADIERQEMIKYKANKDAKEAFDSINDLMSAK